MYGVLLSRFTNETLIENRRWRETHNIPCIYSNSLAISENLPLIDYFVIEMNINTNKIAGIGLIENKLEKRGPKIYSNPYFNRYIYKGKYFIPIEQIKNVKILEELEKLLFYGKGHLKRGGLTLFPPKLLKKEYFEWLKDLLKENVSIKENDSIKENESIKENDNKNMDNKEVFDN
jgi:hypothetical protein